MRERDTGSPSLLYFHAFSYSNYLLQQMPKDEILSDRLSQLLHFFIISIASLSALITFFLSDLDPFPLTLIFSCLCRDAGLLEPTLALMLLH